MPAESCAFTVQCLYSILTSRKYSVIFPLKKKIFDVFWGYLTAMPELYRITVILV